MRGPEERYVHSVLLYPSRTSSLASTNLKIGGTYHGADKSEDGSSLEQEARKPLFTFRLGLYQEDQALETPTAIYAANQRGHSDQRH